MAVSAIFHYAKTVTARTGVDIITDLEELLGERV